MQLMPLCPQAGYCQGIASFTVPNFGWADANWLAVEPHCETRSLMQQASITIVSWVSSFCRFDFEGNGHASTPQELDDVMHAIGSDKQRYEAMLAWRYRKVCVLRSKPKRRLSLNHLASGEPVEGVNASTVAADAIGS